MILRRRGDLPLVSLAVSLAAILVAAESLADSALPAIFLIGVLAALTGVAYTWSQMKARRVGRLLDKYHDESIVGRIINREYWQVQTDEQLRDSLGGPDAVEDQRMITRSRQVWSYGRGKPRTTLDDDVMLSSGKG
jgi:hypothetical protein